jgi:protoheme IX farnesyltransferase
MGDKKAAVEFRCQLLAASILLFLLITFGGILRVSGGESACPDWSLCIDKLTFNSNVGIGLDLIHRLLAMITGLVLVFAIGKAWLSFRHQRWITAFLSLAGVLYVVEIFLGVLLNPIAMPGVRTALHFGLSLVIQALLLGSTVLAFYPTRRTPRKAAGILSDPFIRSSMISAGAVFLLLVSGAIVVATGAAGSCGGWPFCQGTSVTMPQNTLQWIAMLHRILTLFAALSIANLFYRAWNTKRQRADLLVSATIVGVLFLAQSFMGAVESEAGFPAYLNAIHQGTATAIWVAAVITLLSAVVGNEPARVDHEERVRRLARRTLKDFLALTKPIVVLLLLVTTYAGMVIAGRSWPSLGMTFWVLLGGFMAAGGSSAINQFIDHLDDGKMQRTQKRPIPAGRLTPAEGLAFGVGLSLSSFYVMVAYVNLLAAFLTLAGIIYYVLIYSIFLKKTTVQNIVIGGGAGAIPPLVGWAAVTGSLNVPALFLFAVVFLWTPPHFWALAIVRRNDYARAGVPMLPVVRGQAETRKQIFIYTVELVVLTLLLPLFGLGGSIYLVAAVVLGAGLLGSAWRVWKQEGNKVAWKMYRHSSMYLAFIFAALMVDALI